MEENLDKLFDYRPLIPGSGRFASIVGIGGGAGRVVDQMRKCCLPDVQLYAFGMNRKEMDELSLCGKYLIGQEGLGSGKDRFLAEYECSKFFPAIESVLRGRLVAVFVVCLGGGTGEGCIRSFLQKAREVGNKVIILVATIPHSSEGAEKRKNALGLLKALEPMADALYTVDYDDSQYAMLTEVYQEADRKIIEFTDSLLGMVLRRCMITFDFNDFRTFLQFPTPSKHIDFFMLAGSLDFLRKEVKDWWKKLPAKYSSADEVAMAVFSIENADWSDDKETTEAMDVVHECFLQLPPDAEVKWGIYPDETLPPHQFRLRVFTKCKR